MKAITKEEIESAIIEKFSKHIRFKILAGLNDYRYYKLLSSSEGRKRLLFLVQTTRNMLIQGKELTLSDKHNIRTIMHNTHSNIKHWCEANPDFLPSYIYLILKPSKIARRDSEKMKILFDRLNLD